MQLSPTSPTETMFNLTAGVTPLSHDIYSLHMTVFWVCVAIAIAVFSVLFYSIIHHRKSKGVKAADFHEHLWIEITWTIIPLLILILLAIPSTQVLIAMNNTEQEDITIKITGYQWKWHYDYIKQDLRFFSNMNTPQNQIQNLSPKDAFYLRTVDHPLVVPIHKKIRFLMTSNDVIHSWWVPALGVKRDALPGFINEAWARINKPGTYYGQCTEFCGMNHAYMPIVVIALSEQDFENWITQQKAPPPSAADINKKWTLDELMKHGEQVYLGTCAACHQPTGMGLPPTFPALKGSTIATGPVNAHLDRVLHGKPGTAMQAFKDQLSDIDLAAVITYERNAWGNNKSGTVQIVQPEDIPLALQKTKYGGIPHPSSPVKRERGQSLENAKIAFSSVIGI